MPLTVAVAQPGCTPLDIAANAAAHAEAVGRSGARLVVLPELSLTGYDLAAPAVSADDPRLRPLSRRGTSRGRRPWSGRRCAPRTGGNTSPWP
ncbi:nitrilase-related carbon-nitrogen hydrolase [Streptomyces sp. NPDC056178]|uniref:nitrilase-related carbon-nitrogen hydrolase n=1 Tax=unclassified Streptomyces TaxID=2593676 RepID=UPI0035E0B006